MLWDAFWLLQMMAVLFWLGTASLTLCFDFQAIYDVFNKWHGIDLWGGNRKGFSITNTIPPPFFLLCVIEVYSSPWKWSLEIVMVLYFLKVPMSSPTKRFCNGKWWNLSEWTKKSLKGAFELMKVRYNQFYYLQRLELLFSPWQSWKGLLYEDPFSLSARKTCWDKTFRQLTLQYYSSFFLYPLNHPTDKVLL